MAAWKLAPALACGNTVILKPAEQTPLTALRLGELICEAGLPDGVVNIVTGFGQGAGSSIAEHPDIDKVAFTGSTEVGKLILQGLRRQPEAGLAGTRRQVAQHHFPRRRPAIRRCRPRCWESSSTQGQVCCAGSRMFVQANATTKFVDKLTQLQQDRQHGRSASIRRRMIGPLVSQEQFDRVKGYLASRQEGGRQVSAGGEAGAGKGYFVKPTLFSGVNNEMRIAREEIFGPVGAAIPFKDENDAVLAGQRHRLTGSPPRSGPATSSRAHRGRARAQGRHGLDQLLQPTRSDLAVWRLQAVGLWPRTGQICDRSLHANQIGIRQDRVVER